MWQKKENKEKRAEWKHQKILPDVNVWKYTFFGPNQLNVEKRKKVELTDIFFSKMSGNT